MDPVAGTAYKFGMVQEKVSSTDVYYLAGGMNSYYLATTTDVNAAIDVYLEATTGGYYMYTMDGSSKLYINMVTKVSGDQTHINGAYEATASTVYSYDATSKTVKAQVDGADYWFGTRNDKTYTTVGPCKTSYNGFYCKFYALDGSGSGSTGGDNTGSGSGSTTVPTTPAEIIAAAYALAENESLPYAATLTGKIISVNESYNSTFGNVTVTIAVEGSEAFPIKCYRIKGNGADVIKVGDTITVTGILTNYSGTIEFAKDSSLDSYTPGTGEDTGADTSNATFTKVTDVSQILDGGEFVIASYHNGAYHVLNTDIEKYIPPVEGVTVTNDAITGQNVPVWTIAAMDDGISLSNGTSYMKWTSGTSLSNSGTTAYKWLVSENGDTDTFQIQAASAPNAERWLCYRDSSAAASPVPIRFAAYKFSETNFANSDYNFYLILFEKNA